MANASYMKLTATAEHSRRFLLVGRILSFLHPLTIMYNPFQTAVSVTGISSEVSSPAISINPMTCLQSGESNSKHFPWKSDQTPYRSQIEQAPCSFRVNRWVLYSRSWSFMNLSAHSLHIECSVLQSGCELCTEAFPTSI